MQYVNASLNAVMQAWALTRLALQAARRTWRPKRLQKGGRNPKKSMLKNNRFSTSIFEGFGHRFGRIFGMFFEAKKACEQLNEEKCPTSQKYCKNELSI